jgi:hypothetical protein
MKEDERIAVMTTSPGADLAVTRHLVRFLRFLSGKREAMALFVEVQREFTRLELPYDAALVSLELAVLYLEDGRTAEVRELALEMAWIFKIQKIAREALAALRLFCDAAARDAATVDLARQVWAEVDKLSRLGPRPAGPAPAR